VETILPDHTPNPDTPDPPLYANRPPQNPQNLESSRRHQAANKGRPTELGRSRQLLTPQERLREETASKHAHLAAELGHSRPNPPQTIRLREETAQPQPQAE